MDRGFFRSKEFYVAIALAGLLVVGGAVALGASQNFQSVRHFVTCDLPAPGGSPRQAQVQRSEIERAGLDFRQTVVYTVDLADAPADRVRICTDVGDVRVGTVDGTTARVTFHLRGDSEQALRETQVQAVFGGAAGTDVLAQVVQSAEVRSLFKSDSTSVEIVVELPAAGAWGVQAETAVGDIDLGEMMVADVDLSTDVGDIGAEGLDGGGNVTVTTDVGDVDLAFRSVRSGRFEVSTDVGDVALALPRSPDVGYDVDAAASVGSIDVDIGATESLVRDEEGPGGSVEARSAGHDARPTKVAIHARTDVGDIDVVAA